MRMAIGALSPPRRPPPMSHRSRRLAFAAAVIGLTTVAPGLARAGMITSLASGGPGGTAAVAIESGFPQGNVAAFTANFTAVAPIVITIGVDGPGHYALINPSSPGLNVTNSTGLQWAAFEFALAGVPAGSQLSGASQSTDD